MANKVAKKPEMVVPEVWVPIKGFNRYVISNYGRVLNVKMNRIVEGSERSGGTRIALLGPQGTLQYRFLHRLIAETFLPKYKERKQYLESEILEQLPINMGAEDKKLHVKRRFIQVVGTDEYYDNVIEAAKALNCDRSTVYKLLKGGSVWAERSLKYVWV